MREDRAESQRGQVSHQLNHLVLEGGQVCHMFPAMAAEIQTDEYPIPMSDPHLNVAAEPAVQETHGLNSRLSPELTRYADLRFTRDHETAAGQN